MPALPLHKILDFDVQRVPPLGKTCHSCFRSRKFRVTASTPDGTTVTNDYCGECVPQRTRQTLADVTAP